VGRLESRPTELAMSTDYEVQPFALGLAIREMFPLSLTL
jgi:hypothetical protein